MPILNFWTTPDYRKRIIEVDTSKVLAVKQMVVQRVTPRMAAHQRVIYTDQSRVDVWCFSDKHSVPPIVAELDKLGGKPHVRLAAIEKYETAPRAELAHARSIAISRDISDAGVVQLLRHRDAAIMSTKLSGAFTTSAIGEIAQSGTRMYFASVALGNRKIAVAHVDPMRISLLGTKCQPDN